MKSEEFHDLPPCADSPDLFTSTDVYAHAEARQVCWTMCDRREWCEGELVKARSNAPSWAGPEGTWAGMLVTRGGLGANDTRTVHVDPADDVTGACGTPKGYARHQRQNIWPACAPCKQALSMHRAYLRMRAKGK
jgi:hypothetical protein